MIIHKYFRIVRIKPPYRVNLYKLGETQLDKLSFKQAEELHKTGCRFLELTPEGRKHYHPDEKPIEVKELKKPPEEKPAKKK